VTGPRIALLLGRAPGRHSILPAVVGHLRAAGSEVTAHLWDDTTRADVAAADLVVLRALPASALGAVAADADAARCCNTPAATAAARDKSIGMPLLGRAGVPVPRITAAATWTAAQVAAGGRPVVIKAVDGSRGRGVLLAPDGRLPASAPFPGPYLVEEHVAGDGRDRKLYVIGDRVHGVLRRWPPRHLADKLGEPVEPEPALRSLALAAGAALGLEVYGVDVVVGPAGPVVVDVNAFPGFKGVPGAAPEIARHLLGRVRVAEEVAACAR
jgi:ribosomal protein S6--L-glutamate ligase